MGDSLWPEGPRDTLGSEALAAEGLWGLGSGDRRAKGTLAPWVLSHALSADHAACGLCPHHPVQQPVRGGLPVQLPGPQPACPGPFPCAGLRYMGPTCGACRSSRSGSLPHLGLEVELNLSQYVRMLPAFLRQEGPCVGRAFPMTLSFCFLSEVIEGDLMTQ